MNQTFSTNHVRTYNDLGGEISAHQHVHAHSKCSLLKWINTLWDLFYSYNAYFKMIYILISTQKWSNTKIYTGGNINIVSKRLVLEWIVSSPYCIKVVKRLLIVECHISILQLFGPNQVKTSCYGLVEYYDYYKSCPPATNDLRFGVRWAIHKSFQMMWTVKSSNLKAILILTKLFGELSSHTAAQVWTALVVRILWQSMRSFYSPLQTGQALP